ncbi:fasciclin-like arabinogalactan protein 4 [Hordeum vulgare]|nr:fasciclin-like arabinogalactan protein 4 [Hordeum vulgare]
MRGQISRCLVLLALAGLLLLALLPPPPAVVDVQAVLADTARRAQRRPSAVALGVRGRHGSGLADVLRYHVLLEYLSPADLRRLPASGKLVTTLFQILKQLPSF